MSCHSKDQCWEVPHLCSWPNCQSAASREADRAAVAAAQGTLPDEPHDPLKAAIWQALLPFREELLSTGGVTFMGLRNAVAEAVRPFTNETLSGFSGCSVRMIRGSKADIDLVQQWCHDASTIPALRARIRSAEAALAAATESQRSNPHADPSASGGLSEGGR